MNTCQTVIGANVVFRQLLDGILTEESTPSLGKLKGPPMIKNQTLRVKK
jgi:hypothetical protein